MSKSKVILAAAMFVSFSSAAATVHLGQSNAAWDLRAGTGVNVLRVGDDLSNVSAALGNTGTIEIDGTSFVHAGQLNRVAYQGAYASVSWVGVGGDLDTSAISVGNMLDIDIAECGRCGTGSHVGVVQTNMNISNGATSYLNLASIGGSVTNTAAAIGNSASITIVN